MEQKSENKQDYIKAKEKVKALQLFYIHLLGYIILMGLLTYNLFIVQGEYKTAIIWLDSCVMVGWTIFIAVHAWNVFKGRLLFKESWEDRKIDEIIKEDQEGEEEVTLWE
ncbi:2TM domain-containing protein [Winogradskyella sp. 3972H.M.0a.05]|uniref:2TM domain-containing protein n=1 Tax=Winogradskyella sp. 3972H.M.0a.05 TaxID=2950277 RepID=UPI003394E6BA